MIRDDAVAPLGDLLLQAVEGMERPSVRARWRLALPVHQPGRCPCARPHGREHDRPRHLGGVPGGAGLARSRSCTGGCRRTAGPGAPRPGSPRSASGSGPTPSSPRPASWSPTTTSRSAASSRRSGRRPCVPARSRRPRPRTAAAVAEEAGRHLMLLGDINLAMTSTSDTDEAVQHFAELVVPLLADWCLVTVLDENGKRRDVGRAHRDPALVAALNRYADVRAAGNSATAPVPRLLRDVEPVVIPELTPELIVAMVSDPESRQAAGAACARPRSPPFRSSRVVSSSAGSRWSTGPSAGRTPRPSCGRRRSPPAGRPWPWTTPGSPRPTSRSLSGCREPSLPAGAARSPPASRPVPAGDPGGVDRRGLVRRLPSARRRHRARHRRRHGPRHRGRRGHGAGQDPGSRDRVRPARGAGRGAAPGRPRARRAGRADARHRPGRAGRAGRRRTARPGCAGCAGPRPAIRSRC